MKSPAELKALLRRQWENRALREARLLRAESSWPIVVPIGRPSPRLIRANLEVVRSHVETWRRVKVGEVVWEAIRYRAAEGLVDIPLGWKIRRPSEWIDACGDDSIRQECQALATLVEQSDPSFHSLLVRQRYLWRDKPLGEVIQAARLAMNLRPGLAAGRPLRALSVEGIDTKFFERNGRLVTSLLDRRFDGEVSKIGLEVFLGALTEGDHRLLVMDLDGSLLPFRKQWVRSFELPEAALPGEKLLIVENESCQHLIPNVPRTVAVLGAGFDLAWASGLQLANKRIAYWGDIDTWGLQFLAKAREAIGALDALMMTADVFNRFVDSAVPEPVVAGTNLPVNLSQSERSLYKLLLNESRGRLEQEFLPEEFIHEAILNWARG
jgi:hypothetical protein